MNYFNKFSKPYRQFRLKIIAISVILSTLQLRFMTLLTMSCRPRGGLRGFTLTPIPAPVSRPVYI